MQQRLLRHEFRKLAKNLCKPSKNFRPKPELHRRAYSATQEGLFKTNIWARASQVGHEDRFQVVTISGRDSGGSGTGCRGAGSGKCRDGTSRAWNSSEEATCSLL